MKNLLLDLSKVQVKDGELMFTSDFEQDFINTLKIAVNDDDYTKLYIAEIYHSQYHHFHHHSVDRKFDNYNGVALCGRRRSVEWIAGFIAGIPPNVTVLDISNMDTLMYRYPSHNLYAYYIQEKEKDKNLHEKIFPALPHTIKEIIVRAGVIIPDEISNDLKTRGIVISFNEDTTRPYSADVPVLNSPIAIVQSPQEEQRQPRPSNDVGVIPVLFDIGVRTNLNRDRTNIFLSYKSRIASSSVEEFISTLKIAPTNATMFYMVDDCGAAPARGEKWITTLIAEISPNFTTLDLSYMGSVNESKLFFSKLDHITAEKIDSLKQDILRLHRVIFASIKPSVTEIIIRNSALIYDSEFMELDPRVTVIKIPSAERNIYGNFFVLQSPAALGEDEKRMKQPKIKNMPM